MSSRKRKIIEEDIDEDSHSSNQINKSKKGPKTKKSDVVILNKNLIDKESKESPKVAIPQNENFLHINTNKSRKKKTELDEQEKLDFIDDNDNDKEIKKVQKELKSLEEKNINLIDDNKKMKEENKKFKEEIDYKNSEIKKLNKRIKFLEDMVNFLENNDNKDKEVKSNEKINLNNNNINNNINNNPYYFNINNNPKGEIRPKKTPIDKYKKPTFIGLQNIGATCFMNSTLQCLSQTKNLTNYFLKEENKKNILNNNISRLNDGENQLAPVYFELIHNLWKMNSNEKYYAPYNFMNRVNDMNSLFKRGEAGDSKDFILFVLQQMHKELKKSLNIKNINNPNQINQYDKNITLMNFFNEFTKETSIISDLFFGFNETTNICSNCKNYYSKRNESYPICYNYGIFNLLIFPLEEVKNMKNKNNMNNIFNFYPGPSNVVNINDCFLYNQKTDFFTGENKIYCNICKQMSDSEYTSKIFISPNVLIMILNRGKGNIYNIKLDFKNTIDITDFVIQKEKPRIVYNLYGVITHIGKSGPNAHFIASCKSPVDGKWYKYNDALVEPIKDFVTEVYNYGVPYILFYEKENI